MEVTKCLSFFLSFPEPIPNPNREISDLQKKISLLSFFTFGNSESPFMSMTCTRNYIHTYRRQGKFLTVYSTCTTTYVHLIVMSMQLADALFG